MEKQLEQMINYLRVKSHASIIVVVTDIGNLIAYSLEHPFNGMTIEKMKDMIVSLLSEQNKTEILISFKERIIKADEITTNLPVTGSDKERSVKALVINTEWNLKLLIIDPGIDYSEQKEIFFNALETIVK